MFSGSGSSVVLSGRLDVETGSKKFKMAAAKPEIPTIPYTNTDPIASIALAVAGISESL